MHFGKIELGSNFFLFLNICDGGQSISLAIFFFFPNAWLSEFRKDVLLASLAHFLFEWNWTKSKEVQN